MRTEASQQVMRDHVRSILLWHDPMHVGVASDGYAPEVERILGGLDTTRSEQDVAHLVRSIFVEMFDSTAAGPIDRYLGIGKEIWQAHTSAG